MDQANLIIVDDEADLRHALSQGLELAGHKVRVFPSADGVIDVLARDFYGALITDIRMPGEDGLALMRKVVEIDPTFPVILITGHGDVTLAVEAMRAGAYDFIEKPFAVTRLAAIVERALEKRRLVLENRVLRRELAHSGGIDDTLVGKSASMQRLRDQVAMLAETDADVLILGETGTGKEVVARALHNHGPRHGQPFVAINCGALPADIIESELFGHEQGAFTGASRRRIGKLEHANGGTVFLDEIESMPPDLQVKLLRVIEERSVERLGSNRSIALNIRFLAASKIDLERASRDGGFRQDLFYRLNVVNIALPPLRARKEDIPVLFYHLAREARARYRREIPDIDSTTLARLMAHDWPGNVRELRNAADRFVLGLGTTDSGEVPPGANSGAGALAAQIADYEKNLIEAEIARNGGKLKPTYETLGISRKALYDKMRKYGIGQDDVREE